MVKDSGELDRRVLFQRPIKTRGANGEEISTFETYGYRWAKMENSSGLETLQDNRILLGITTRFTIRYDPLINRSYRLKYKHTYYNIINMVEEGRRMYLVMDCEATEDEDYLTADNIEVTADTTFYNIDIL